MQHRLNKKLVCSMCYDRENISQVYLRQYSENMTWRSIQPNIGQSGSLFNQGRVTVV